MTDPVARAEELLAEITPGPWRTWDKRGQDHGYWLGDRFIVRGQLPPSSFGIVTEAEAPPYRGQFSPWAFEDAVFIAASPSLVVDLVAEVKRLRETRLEAAIIIGQLLSDTEPEGHRWDDRLPGPKASDCPWCAAHDWLAKFMAEPAALNPSEPTP